MLTTKACKMEVTVCMLFSFGMRTSMDRLVTFSQSSTNWRFMGKVKIKRKPVSDTSNSCNHTTHDTHAM